MPLSEILAAIEVIADDMFVVIRLRELCGWLSCGDPVVDDLPRSAFRRYLGEKRQTLKFCAATDNFFPLLKQRLEKLTT